MQLSCVKKTDVRCWYNYH